jgi:hypothetical protein
MQMADEPTSLLAPFDEETQVLLLEVDAACSLQMQQLMEKINQAALAGDEEYKMDLETMVWTKVIRAYGKLMNRAIDAGWISGVKHL